MATEPVCLPGEIWKPVEHPNYLEPIEVSSLGRVRRPGRTYFVPSGRVDVSDFTCTRPTRIAKQLIRNGYPSVCIKHAKGRPYIALHTLLCLGFVGPQPTPEHETAHWDGDPLNWAIANLRWATPLENAADRERHGRTAKGVLIANAVLSDEIVVKIREAYKVKSYPGHTAVAALIGCHRSTVARAARGDRWKHIG